MPPLALLGRPAVVARAVRRRCVLQRLPGRRGRAAAREGGRTGDGSPLSSLRVAFLVYRGNPHCGGQGVYTRHLTRELVALGHRVEVFSGQPWPELDDGVELVTVPSLDLYREPDPFRIPRLRELASLADVVEFATCARPASASRGRTRSARAPSSLGGPARRLRRRPRRPVPRHGLLGCSPTAGRSSRRSTTRSPSTARSTSSTRRVRCAGAYAPALVRLPARCRPGWPGAIPRILTVSESSRRDIVDAARRRRPSASTVVPVGVDPRCFRPHARRRPRARAADDDRERGRADEGARAAARGGGEVARPSVPRPTWSSSAASSEREPGPRGARAPRPRRGRDLRLGRAATSASRELLRRGRAAPSCPRSTRASRCRRSRRWRAACRLSPRPAARCPRSSGADGDSRVARPARRPRGAGARHRPPAGRPGAAPPHGRGGPLSACWSASPGGSRRGARPMVRAPPARRGPSTSGDRMLTVDLRPAADRPRPTRCSTWAAAFGRHAFAGAPARRRRGRARRRRRGGRRRGRASPRCARRASCPPPGDRGARPGRRASPAVRRRRVRPGHRRGGARAHLRRQAGDRRARAGAARRAACIAVTRAARLARAASTGRCRASTTRCPGVTSASTAARSCGERLERAGLRLVRSHHAHALHSPYWWLRCLVGVGRDDHPLVAAYHRFLVWDIVKPPAGRAPPRTAARPGDRQEPGPLPGEARRRRGGAGGGAGARRTGRARGAPRPFPRRRRRQRRGRRRRALREGGRRRGRARNRGGRHRGAS